MQVFKHQLDLPCKLGKGLGIEQFNFYNFSFSNGFKDKRNVIETVLTFFQKKKKSKKLPSGLMICPIHPYSTEAGGFAPRPPGVVRVVVPVGSPLRPNGVKASSQ